MLPLAATPLTPSLGGLAPPDPPSCQFSETGDLLLGVKPVQDCNMTNFSDAANPNGWFRQFSRLRRQIVQCGLKGRQLGSFQDPDF